MYDIVYVVPCILYMLYIYYILCAIYHMVDAVLHGTTLYHANAVLYPTDSDVFL